MNQSLSFILFRYLSWRFLSSFLMVFGGLLVIVYFIDSIDVTRGLSKYGSLTFNRAALMTLMKLPEVGFDLMPFCILIAAVFTLWRLTRTSELVVVRATGVSAWQFLSAPICMALLIAFFKMMVLNPVGASMIARYEMMDAQYMSNSASTVNIGKTGLWLRQRMDDGRIAIIHADTVKLPEWVLSPVTAFFFDSENNLTHRIDSREAALKEGEWIFSDAWSNVLQADHSTPHRYGELRLPTAITSRDIQNRFASPQTVSFWNLPDYARIMRDTGFESNPLWARFYSLLAEPVLNVALVFLAGALALRAPRMQRGWWLVMGTVCVGFIVFFLGDFLEILGISERLPIMIAAFAPAMISLLMGLTALLYLEDG
jgi:lipopolysaccharide export system permease protein